MKSRIIQIFIGLGGLILLYGLLNVDLVSYLWMQGRGQFEVLWNAEAVERLMNDDQVSSEMKNKLELVNEVKVFAEAELGLRVEGLYTTIYDQKGNDILWNLSACKPYALEQVEWHFPIVGSVTYKGFFDLERAKKEEQAWIDKGYDTRIRPVNAWSTLGWFSDPILSNNLIRPEGDVAELFIHEMTHTNVFFKDSLTFDENLASFIGEQGASRFLIYKYGKESKEYIQYTEKESDTKKFIRHCLKGVEELDSLYQSLEQDSSEELKKSKKEGYLHQWVAQLDTMSFNQSERFHGKFMDHLPNNAFFMGFERYDSKKDGFNSLLLGRFNGDLRRFIDHFKKQM